MFSCWSQDIYSIFTNLIDNSLYWMEEKRSPERKIAVDVVTVGDALLHIDYRDTGPGIEPDLIASEVIFEPQFSTKPHGTGIGLPIAGEAAARNGLELRAFESEAGGMVQTPIGSGERGMNGIRVLIVEDDERDLDTCRSTVERYQLETGRRVELYECRDVEEAFSMLDDTFDGVVIDLTLNRDGDAGNRVIKKNRGRVLSYSGCCPYWDA